MKCTHCNEETDPINSQGHTQICESCETNRIENNVLAFIHRNLHGNNHEDVINHCIGIFKNPEDIEDAKASIFNVYGEKIREIDSKLHSEIKKSRRDGGRPKQVANVRDIISILITLDGRQHKPNIIAKDTDKVPLLKDMAMASSTTGLMEKITELESKFAGFEAKFVENEQMKSDYSEMKAQFSKLNSRMEEIHNKLIDAQALIVVLEDENKRLTNELKSNIVSGVDDSIGSSSPSSSSSSSASFSSKPSSHVDGASVVSTDTIIEASSTGGTWGEMDNAINNDKPDAAKPVQHIKQIKQHPLHMQLSARQRYQRNIHVTQKATLIAAQATAMGISPENAANIANFAAKNIAQSYTRQTDKSAENHLTYSQVASEGIETDQTNNNGYPSLTESNGFKTVDRSKGKRRLNQYQLGNRQVKIGLAAPKPDWHENKTLVIAGLEKSLLSHKSVISEKINELANKEIKIHHMEILSKVYNHWLTIAIELSPLDYTLLNSQDFWPAGIRIRPFQGRRKWRTSLLTKEVRSNSVHMSWT